MSAVFVAIIPILLYTFVAALSAFRIAPRASLQRSRAGGYLLAFATHDVLWAAHTLLVDVWPSPEIGTPFRTVLIYASIAIPLLFALLLGYAVLRWHVFDIDLRIKRGLSRGTLAGAFLGVFFVVAAVAEQYLQQFGILAGGIAVGALLLALRPLERAADRFANAAMPGVTGSPEYVAYRKLQVYRATVESALEDGRLSPKERAMLDTFARELGIGAEDARAVEAEVARA